MQSSKSSNSMNQSCKSGQAFRFWFRPKVDKNFRLNLGLKHTFCLWCTKIYRIYSRIGRNFFLIFFNKKHGCDLFAPHTLKVFGYCKYRIFRLISRYRHELRLRLCSHIPMRDSFMRAHVHATAQRALDFPALLRRNGFCDFNVRF